MPPGNNNAKPAPRGKCTYCRQETCKGDNCTFSGIERICGTSNVSQVRYVSPYTSADGDSVRSTYNSRNDSKIGNVVATPKTLDAGSSIQQRNVTATFTAVQQAEPYPKAANSLQPESKEQNRNATSIGIKVHRIAPENTSSSLWHTSYDSKPRENTGTYESHTHLRDQGLMDYAQGISKILSIPTQLATSTEVSSKEGNVVTDKSPLPTQSVTTTEKKLLENEENTVKGSSFTSASRQEQQPKVLINKNFSNIPQSIDVKVNDEIKLPISKPSSCASISSKNSCNSDVVDKTKVKQPKAHHSAKALKYEGVVYQILGSRNAKVRVAERNGLPIQKSEWGAADAVHKFALLMVDKIMKDDSESFYPQNVHISSVLSKGDIVVLICTTHNKLSSGFQLFAHQAWRTDQKNNDADSVVSYCSQTGSETQESTSSKTKRRTRRKKHKKNVPNEDSFDVSDAVNQWLSTNQHSQNRNESSKKLKLIVGCHYIGKVVEMRLPYAFIVEISSNDGKQPVFVFSSHFHPQGISSPAVPHGVSLESIVSIGDEIVVTPNKNTAMQDDKFEWIATKAWPKNMLSTTSENMNCFNKSEQLIDPAEKLNQPGNTVVKTLEQQGVESFTNLASFYPLAKKWKEFDGVILSLQYDWGLVKKAVGKESAYVFTRKNSYLFGLCLQHFILDDVLKEGQLVKFSMEAEEIGAMNALAVWCGNKFSDFNSFDVAASKYCEEKEIKFSTEELLIQHGKLMYFGQ